MLIFNALSIRLCIARLNSAPWLSESDREQAYLVEIFTTQSIIK